MKSLEELFGINLHRMRVKKGISQQQLADVISFSNKAVSNWERGRGIPDIAVLYKMADFFQVKLDDFFTEQAFYYLGIDGGGTKTALTLTDKDMNVLRQEITEGCNPVDIGIEASLSVLKNGINKICNGIQKSRVFMFAGIAGGTASNNKDILTDFFKEFGFMDYQNDNDAANIIAAGLNKNNGIAMIMGTGIVAFCQKNGVCKKTSGWGYLIDNGGSAYNIGRDALSAHFEALDGLGAPTAISDILIKMQPDSQLLLKELYDGRKRTIAKYNRIVYEAAKNNDPVAVSILRRNMKFAANVLENAASPLEEEKITVVLAGGLTEEEDTLKYLREELTAPERFDIQVLTCLPVMGAVWMAKKLADRFAEGDNPI